MNENLFQVSTCASVRSLLGTSACLTTRALSVPYRRRRLRFACLLRTALAMPSSTYTFSPSIVVSMYHNAYGVYSHLERWDTYR
ncbi:hypothetical protein FIBSPDRAFT_854480 [Athelia psychrophila]|uniref:Uncharacterized protein n=1 Tax=Athelia psychrophila TaxID=1759441 RepID=A0A166Q6A1_9AGAM|nr:hypothetical protein FIBSPDRAFT_854480 [Fibularhizoctonia sp. CBS 109695]